MKSIDWLIHRLGNLAAWLLLALVLTVVAVVVLRYVLGTGSVLLQEVAMYLHAAALLVGIPYALQHDAHVRVDLIYSRLPETRRTAINLAGHLLFLVPLALCLLYFTWPYAARSWQILEGSAEVGGLPAVFILKSLLPFMAILLLIQGISCIAHCLRSLRGDPAPIEASHHANPPKTD